MSKRGSLAHQPNVDQGILDIEETWFESRNRRRPGSRYGSCASAVNDVVVQLTWISLAYSISSCRRVFGNMRQEMKDGNNKVYVLIQLQFYFQPYQSLPFPYNWAFTRHSHVSLVLVPFSFRIHRRCFPPPTVSLGKRDRSQTPSPSLNPHPFTPTVFSLR
ncbi:uncharacterized protein BT62DRAFT_1004401 [Guyanagaster necrorhizus]|uniref:Uncharacterized protein n=1 Tax=Guyanagaster necrorhizus TaxID=856835 RepID=A0A9P7VW53_9AGAR|nr:uncharacterized protein BT62DRAFT_1004401 [Guyanagaster necrorhizus MCA 3950]KAG7447642.1 hypothetical protein BT62DRAFT_1004401 [Guyanagaster necrorhizus MCA 3950]